MGTILSSEYQKDWTRPKASHKINLFSKGLSIRRKTNDIKLPSMVHRRKRSDMFLMVNIMIELVRVNKNKLFERARMQSTRCQRLPKDVQQNLQG